MKIYLATTNPGKLRDFAGLAPATEWRLLPDFASLPVAEETGGSFAANARQKAEHYSRLRPGWIVADDSGLEVEALGGEPGVDSALYAGRHGDDQANNRLLLERLRTVNASRRQARFVCVLALARAGYTEKIFTGYATGIIVDAPRGALGFGYDPLFYSPAAGCTFGELPADRKAAFSHRGAAVRALADWLNSGLAGKAEGGPVAAQREGGQG